MAEEKKEEKYERYEDDPKNVSLVEEGFKPARLSAKEVPLEDSRKDKTTLLASDAVVVTAEGDVQVAK